MRVTAQHLARHDFAAAYSSPQGRAVLTAMEILRHHPDLPLTVDPDLRELSFGSYEGGRSRTSTPSSRGPSSCRACSRAPTRASAAGSRAGTSWRACARCSRASWPRTTTPPARARRATGTCSFLRRTRPHARRVARDARPHRPRRAAQRVRSDRRGDRRRPPPPRGRGRRRRGDGHVAARPAPARTTPLLPASPPPPPIPRRRDLRRDGVVAVFRRNTPPTPCSAGINPVVDGGRRGPTSHGSRRAGRGRPGEARRDAEGGGVPTPDRPRGVARRPPERNAAFLGSPGEPTRRSEEPMTTTRRRAVRGTAAALAGTLLATTLVAATATTATVPFAAPAAAAPGDVLLAESFDGDAFPEGRTPALGDWQVRDGLSATHPTGRRPRGSCSAAPRRTTGSTRRSGSRADNASRWAARPRRRTDGTTPWRQAVLRTTTTAPNGVEIAQRTAADAWNVPYTGSAPTPRPGATCTCPSRCRARPSRTRSTGGPCWRGGSTGPATARSASSPPGRP